MIFVEPKTCKAIYVFNAMYKLKCLDVDSPKITELSLILELYSNYLLPKVIGRKVKRLLRFTTIYLSCYKRQRETFHGL